MTVRTIEFSGQELMYLSRKDLTEYFDNHPRLVASYQIFPKVVQEATEKPALVVKTMDLSAEELAIFAAGIKLLIENLDS